MEGPKQTTAEIFEEWTSNLNQTPVRTDILDFVKLVHKNYADFFMNDDIFISELCRAYIRYRQIFLLNYSDSNAVQRNVALLTLFTAEMSTLDNLIAKEIQDSDSSDEESECRC